MSTDRIEKNILLKAPQERVWRALTDSAQFGTWFGMRLDGAFVLGDRVRGTIAGTQVNPKVAKMQEPYFGKLVELAIDRMEPQHLFSFRWHPYPVDLEGDYSEEPMTQVTFTLEPQTEGVLLTVTETGFDQVPAERRAQALADNEGGWAIQVTLIEAYVTGAHLAG